MAPDPTIELVPVTAANWRDCADLSVHGEQQRFVSAVSYYLCLCNF